MSTKIGIQLYTVRKHAAADPVGTIRAIAACGYEGVQFAGYYDLKAKELRGLLDGLGLEAASAHVGLDLLTGQTEAQLEYADILGMKNITIPHIDQNALTLPQTAEKVLKISEAAKKHGIRLSYHNHYHEFQKENGKTKLDIFFQNVPGVAMELDTYWAAFAGFDPLALMEQYADRLCTVHIKDMKPKPEEREVNANIGEGCLDIAGYLRKAGQLGVKWAFVEMDRCDGDEIDCSRISRENLAKMNY